MDNSAPPRVIIVGAGFIGLEVTEQLVQRGGTTDVVELLPQVTPPLDAEMVSAVHNTLPISLILRLG